MNIDKIKQAIKDLSADCNASNMTVVSSEALKELKALIEPKWEPKDITEYPKIWNTYNAMTDRNRDILLAKTEKGFGDGLWVIVFWIWY